MDDAELRQILDRKPELHDVKNKIKYVVFAGLVQRGWKAVGAEYSGVLTKNDFVLTLYRSDASRFVLTDKSKYVVPAAINYFVIPNTSWTLERYNKIYAYGKMTSLWDYLFDNPAECWNSESFVKFVDEVERIANMHELEMQSVGEMYVELSEDGFNFSVYSGPITDTGIFTPIKDFGPLSNQTVYRIVSATEQQITGNRTFVLQQLQPPSAIEIMLDASLFNEHYMNHELVPLSMHHVKNTDIQLVSADGAAMGGLPPTIQKLNFSLDKQKLIGEAIAERLYVLPLLLAPDEVMNEVLSLIRTSSEFDLLLHLPNNKEYLGVILDFARMGLSIYQPLAEKSVSDAKFCFSELLADLDYEKQQLRQKYNLPLTELLVFLKTHYFSMMSDAANTANYTYLQLMIDNNVLKHVNTCMLSNTITNSSGVLFLHKVYMDPDTITELRAFFYEEKMDFVFEKSMDNFIHVSFDWRMGFGLDCDRYTLIRVPTGYRVLTKDRNTAGFILKVNDEILTYGDLSMITEKE